MRTSVEIMGAQVKLRQLPESDMPRAPWLAHNGYRVYRLPSYTDGQPDHSVEPQFFWFVVFNPRGDNSLVLDVRCAESTKDFGWGDWDEKKAAIKESIDAGRLTFVAARSTRLVNEALEAMSHALPDGKFSLSDSIVKLLANEEYRPPLHSRSPEVLLRFLENLTRAADLFEEAGTQASADLSFLKYFLNSEVDIEQQDKLWLFNSIVNGPVRECASRQMNPREFRDDLCQTAEDLRCLHDDLMVAQGGSGIFQGRHGQWAAMAGEAYDGRPAPQDIPLGSIYYAPKDMRAIHGWSGILDGGKATLTLMESDTSRLKFEPGKGTALDMSEPQAFELRLHGSGGLSNVYLSVAQFREDWGLDDDSDLESAGVTPAMG